MNIDFFIFLLCETHIHLCGEWFPSYPLHEMRVIQIYNLLYLIFL